MECTVEYDGLHHRWICRWVKSPIRDQQVLLHLSHGQTVPVVLMATVLIKSQTTPLHVGLDCILVTPNMTTLWAFA